MSYVGTYFSKFLNTTINPNIKISEILDSINNIYPLLKEGKLFFPNVDFDFETLLDAVNVSNYYIRNKLSYNKAVNGKNIKIGYNPIIIKTLLSDVTLENLLHELNDEQDQLYVFLDQIYKRSNKSLYNFRFFQHIYNDIIPGYSLDLTQFSEQQETFCYISNREPYLPTDYNHVQSSLSNQWIIIHNMNIESTIPIDINCYDKNNNDISSKINNVHYDDTNTITLTFNDEYSGTATIQKNIQVFPFLYAFITLYRLYSGSTIYYNDLLYDIHSNDILGDSEIKDSFEDYISNNLTTIASELSTFIYRSIFQFSGDISTRLNTEAISTIETSLQELPNVFNQSEEAGIFVLETATYLVYDATSLTAYWSAFKLTHDSFYNEMSTYFDFPKGFDWYSMQEDVVTSHIFEHLNSNVELLKMLENISFQFKVDPLYFINSHNIVHGKYVKDLINKIGSGFEIKSWQNSITLKDGVEDSLRQHIEDNYLQQNDDIIKFSAFLKFRSIMNNFIDGDLFTDWIISNFLPALKSSINDNYLIGLDNYKFVDSIKSFMKVLFMKSILESGLFNDFINNFITKFNEYMTSANSELTNDQVTYFSQLFLDNKTLTNILNSFFKGAVLSKYVIGALQNYSL